MHSAIWVVMAVVVAWGLAAQRVPGLVWVTVFASAIALWDVLLDPPAALWIVAWSVFLVVVLPLAFTPLRRVLISAPLLRVFKKIMPAMSDTEREALEAGTVWWEAELFGGDPDWEQLFNLPQPSLSEEEQAFLDGPVEQLCATCRPRSGAS